MMCDIINVLRYTGVAVMLNSTGLVKVSRYIKVREILQDLKSNASDEDLLEKYELTWTQLGKVYARLFYGGFLSRDDLLARLEMRAGKDASHIPLVRIDEGRDVYSCAFCNFSSPFHFSTCPRCQGVNLRRLTKRRSAGIYARRARHATP
jgi:hypothetical protein